MLKQIEKCRDLYRTDASYRALIDAQWASAEGVMKRPGVSQEGDTNEWFHVVEGRLNRPAFLLAVTGAEGHERAAAWLHDAALAVARESADAWIGPFFRKRTVPLSGTLETAHISHAVAGALTFAPELFTEAEREELAAALRGKGQAPLLHWLEPFMAGRADRNNWAIVELGGLAAIACALDDGELFDRCIPLYNELHGDYNTDFYGETMGYWSYAAENFICTYLLAEMFFPEKLSAMADPAIILRPFEWAYYRRQGRFIAQNTMKESARQLTFGDCNTIAEIRHDVLLFASLYLPDARLRALASAWCDELTGGTIAGGESVWFMMMYPRRPAPGTDTSFLPPCRVFGDGYAVYKDRWDHPAVQVAMQSGVSEEPLTVSHRHADYLSFQLAKKGVVLLDDPSRCCYRLNTFKLCCSPGWHSLPYFITEDGKKLEQANTSQKNKHDHAFSRLTRAEIGEGEMTVAAEAGDLYPDEIRVIERTIRCVGTDTLIVTDRWEAAAPVRACATFVCNNRNRGMTWSFGEDSATISREGQTLTIRASVPCTLTMDYCALNDAYSILPDAPTQGREGSGYLIRFEANTPAACGEVTYTLKF